MTVRSKHASILFLVLLLAPRELRASGPRSGASAAQATDLISQADDLKYELGALLTVVTISGFSDWKWGTAYFRFQPEGWFRMDTGSGGQDKLGHTYGSYLMTEFLYLRQRTRHGPAARVSIYPALFVWVLMSYVELFDGFSVDHGFAYEDLVMDTTGLTLSFLRNAYPPLGRLVDFRMEYYPSEGMTGLHPTIDYSGQKFMLALKPAGIEVLRDTPARYLDLLLGYFTRGFLDRDEQYYPDKRTRLFVGVGVNLEQLVMARLGLSEPAHYAGTALEYGVSVFRYFQLPDSYVWGTVHQRRAPH